MNKNRRRPRRRANPLRVSLAERLGKIPLKVRPPKTHPPRLMPRPPRSAQDILGLLMAATGFALAARRPVVELLPGSPVTVLVTRGDKPAAAFVLPISEAEARRAFGYPAAHPRNHLLEQLFEEDRQAELAQPDVLLDQHRAFTWGLDHAH